MERPNLQSVPQKNVRCIISFNLWELQSLEKGFGAEKLLSKSGVVEFIVGIVNWGVVPCRGSPIVVTYVVVPRRHVEPPSLMGGMQA